MMKGETGDKMRERKMEEDRENETHIHTLREVGLLPPEKRKKKKKDRRFLSPLIIWQYNAIPSPSAERREDEQESWEKGGKMSASSLIDGTILRGRKVGSLMSLRTDEDKTGL